MFSSPAAKLDFEKDPLLVRGMDNNGVPRSKSPSRRTFLSASAATAVAAPLVAGAATAHASVTRASARALASGTSARSAQDFDPDLRKMLDEIDPQRIQTIITNLAVLGTRHTASSQTDPNRGIGAAIAYVTQLMQEIAATSSGRMTVQ
jgi:hypothetical protein